MASELDRYPTFPTARDSLIQDALDMPVGKRLSACLQKDGSLDVTRLPQHSLKPTADTGKRIAQQEKQRSFYAPQLQAIGSPPSAAMPNNACSPRSSLFRSHRPPCLDLSVSHGVTTSDNNQSRHNIRGATTAISESNKLRDSHERGARAAAPADERTNNLRGVRSAKSLVSLTHSANVPRAAVPGPYPNFVPSDRMGNQHSHDARPLNLSNHGLATVSTSSLGDDGRSSESILRGPGPKKQNPAHKSLVMIGKQKPLPGVPQLPNDFTATIIQVPRASTTPNLDGGEDEGSGHHHDKKHAERKNRALQHKKALSGPPPMAQRPTMSPATMTEESAARPLSAATTIAAPPVPEKGRRGDPADYDDDEQDPESCRLRVSAFSPKLATPSPLPEDSPHKYGLKDSMDTPEPPSPPAEVDAAAAKTRRRSSGLEIFNEAKNLQTASSFLNGLSTARRRAESRAKSRNGQVANLTSASSTHLPSSAKPSSAYQSAPANHSISHLPLEAPPSPSSLSSRPITPTLDDLSRSLGHTHKSSGFAYAKPLSVVQLKCFRGHERLMRHGNKHYPVECAICHQDEREGLYWSCSWCAARMCGGCRNDLRQHGPKALKAKIRTAEMGAHA